MTTVCGVECTYCREDIRDDATVCRHCGAFKAEDDWFRAGTTPKTARQAWQRSLYLAFAVIAVTVIAGVWWYTSMHDAGATKLECLQSGRTDC